MNIIIRSLGVLSLSTIIILIFVSVNAVAADDIHYVYHSIAGSSEGDKSGVVMTMDFYAGTGNNTDDTVFCNNHCTNFPYDINFTNEDGTTEYPHWIVEGINNSTYAQVKYRVDVPASGLVIKIMYGSGVDTTSNGFNVWDYKQFDDFNNGVTINASIWSTTGNVTQADGKAICNNTTVVYGAGLFTLANTYGLNSSMTFRARLDPYSQAQAGYIPTGAQWTVFSTNNSAYPKQLITWNYNTSSDKYPLGSSYYGQYEVYRVVRNGYTAQTDWYINNINVRSSGNSVSNSTSARVEFIDRELYNYTSSQIDVDWVYVETYTQYSPIDGATSIEDGLPTNNYVAAVLNGTLPESMIMNTTYNVSLTFRNDGTMEWNESSVYLLGTDDAGLFGDIRYNLTGTVENDDSVTFNFTITAPGTMGTYNVRYTMRLADNFNFEEDVQGAIEVTETPSIHYVYHSIAGSSEGDKSGVVMTMDFYAGTGNNTDDTVFCNNHCTNFPYDINFTNEDGTTEYPHWIVEGVNNSTYAQVKYRVDVPASGLVIKIMYGSGVDTTSNGFNVWDYKQFDDFNNGVTINASIWSTTGNVTQADGKAICNNTTGGIDGAVLFTQANTYGLNSSMTFRARLDPYTNSKAGYIPTGPQWTIFGTNNSAYPKQLITWNYNTSSDKYPLGSSYYGQYEVYHVVRNGYTAQTDWYINNINVRSSGNSVSNSTSARVEFIDTEPVNLTSTEIDVDWVYVETYTQYSPIDGATSIEDGLPTNNYVATVLNGTLPETMAINTNYTLNLTFRNDGTLEWNDTSVYLLGTDDAGLFGDTRYNLTGTVENGDSVTFQFTITSPGTMGTYGVRYAFYLINYGYSFNSDVHGNIVVTDIVSPYQTTTIGDKLVFAANGTILRLNAVRMYDPYVNGYSQTAIDGIMAQTVSMGCNAIQIPAYPGYYWKNESAYDTKLDMCINSASALGLYVILTFNPNANPITGAYLDPWYYQASEINSTRFCANMSLRYGDNPFVMIMPWAAPISHASALPVELWWDLGPMQLRPVMDNLTNVVRANAPRMTVFVDAYDAGENITHMAENPLSQSNIVYSVHQWETSGLPPFYYHTWEDIADCNNTIPIWISGWAMTSNPTEWEKEGYGVNTHYNIRDLTIGGVAFWLAGGSNALTTTSNFVSYTLTEWGEFYIDSVADNIRPVSNFTADSTNINAGETVSFTFSGNISRHYPTTYQWSWGDGEPNGTTQNPTHQYTSQGIYTVILTATDDAGTNATIKYDMITVIEPVPTPTPTPTPIPAPIINDFTATPTSGNAPLSIAFHSDITGLPTSWLWLFGDGKTSAERHPWHLYPNHGTYTVSLTVSNSGGSDTMTKSEYITVSSAPAIDYNYVLGPTLGPNPSPPIIDNEAYNLSITALFGNDIRNTTVDNFDGQGFVGALTWWYRTIGPLLIIVIGCVLAMGLYMKYQKVFILSLVLICTGILGGGNMLAFQYPIEWIVFAGFITTGGIAGLIYSMVIGR